MRPLAIALLLAACQREPTVNDSPGGRLERAAIARGLIADPERATLTGSWARDTDRVCIIPGAPEQRIGVLVDYGDGQGCTGSGSVSRHGDRLSVGLGDCRFEAAYDGERIAFPAAMPVACERLCTGRASLASLAVERVSESLSEAVSLRTPSGRALCGG